MIGKLLVYCFSVYMLLHSEEVEEEKENICFHCRNSQQLGVVELGAPDPASDRFRRSEVVDYRNDCVVCVYVDDFLIIGDGKTGKKMMAAG
jgi:hypothetical protein